MQASPTCSFISRLWLSSLLLLAAAGAVAQPRISLKSATDSLPFFRGVALSADLVGPAQLAFGDYGQYEAAMRVNLRDKYFPVVELGYGRAHAEDVATRLAYKTGAPYARAGLDFNLMKNKHDINRLYGGLRYAYTHYQFDLFCPDLTDPTWGERADFRANDVSCYYHWLEFVFGIDAKIWGPLRLGWSVRYKRRLLHDDGYVGRPWYVPGYGKQGNARLGGTFNVTIEL